MDDTSAMSKKAILVISFGTSYNDNREQTIVPTEKAIAEAFPDRELRRAW
ncbi:MAG: sirohydrochlorin cobaltochelatase, partial [Candidatus Methanomethylophilus sp.]|nr:sirohydrochlorin cobaltochelatase [Methanomethylophilus sp.]